MNRDGTRCAEQLVRTREGLARPGAIFTLIAAISLAACAGDPSTHTFRAPEYQPANANVRALQDGGSGKLQVADFSVQPEAGRDFAVFQLRIWIMKSPNGESYADYLREAVRSELAAAGRLSATAALSISAVLVDQELDAAIGKGTCSIKVHFILRRDQATLFDKVLVAQNEWESSFFGNIAIPLAAQAYPATVAKLLQELYSDAEFKAASARTTSEDAEPRRFAHSGQTLGSGT
jgi:uncharacterized lipoprotein YmbA